jgi:DNA primase large subunit
MDNELIRRIARRVFEKSSNINNYIMLEGLIRRFIELNPDADPESIDWSAVWDDTLSYKEFIQAFKEQYPMYRWDDKRSSGKEYGGDRVKDIASEIATKLDAEEFDKLIAELQKIREEVLEDVRCVEAEIPVTEPRPKVEQPQIITQTQPPEKPTGVEIKPSLHLFAKYPFLSSASPLLRTYHITNLPQEVRARAQERVLEAIERGEKGVLPKLFNPWVELLSFPFSRALVLYVGDDWLRRRWALAEAARVERLLHGESDELLLHVINDLGLKTKKTEDGKWVMHFSQYLHLSKRLVTEPRWKLVNRLMDKGLVTLTRPEVIRLVREWLYDSFVQAKPVPVNWYPEEAKAIKEALQRRAAKTVAPAPSKEWAPCMVALRNRVADASHFGLFALAAYMANKGYEVNEVVDVLRVRSDFDERIARYQVEHIAGQRGSRVKYRPPSCQSMKTHGLCIENGKHCPNNIKNPLQYTNRRTT